MKKNILAVAIAVFAVMNVMTACNNNNNRKDSIAENQTETAIDRVHNSRNSLDYEGTYTGVMPCADCSGIQIQINLSGDNYRRKMVYEGKDSEFNDSGKYTWNNEGNIIMLGDDRSEQYLVGENVLYALDVDGNRITGDLAEMYILKKQ